MEHPTKPGKVTVPIHGNATIKPGTLRSALQQAGLTADDLRRLL
jgi:predicted RNA binding protein YcfA (HicA-like mRNA interferase family)